MADFEQVLNKALSGLADNSAEQRRALYDRARASLVAQLKAMTPPLPQTEIAKQRLALEHAIRKVEGQIAIQTLNRRDQLFLKEKPESVAAKIAETAISTTAPAPTPVQEKPKSPQMAAKKAPEVVQPVEETLQAEGDLLPPVHTPYAAAKQPEPELPVRIIDTREEAAPEAVPDEYSVLQRSHSAISQRVSSAVSTLMQTWRVTYQRIIALKDLLTVPDISADLSAPAEASEDERPALKPPRFGRGSLNLAQRRTIMVAMLMLITCVGAGVVLLSSDMIGRVFSSVPRAVIGAVTGEPHTTKFTERLQAETETALSTKNEPIQDETISVAHTAILYEENPNVPQQGEAFKGQVVWRVETETSADGKVEKLMRGHLEVPKRKMNLTFTLRRNVDPSLPASHTVELLFDLPPDFVHKGISPVPGVLMKPAEQARGVPLVGASARITNSYFLIGLSNIPGDKDRNILMLKERSWLEIPVLYDSRTRAVLVMEKGTSGERMFNQVFASWKQ